MDDDEVRAHIADLRARILPRAESMRAFGLEVDAFLEDTERMIALLDGKFVPEGFDVSVFMERMAAFAAEISDMKNLEKEAERISAVAGVPGMLDVTENFLGRLRADGRREEMCTAATLEAVVASARARLARGEVPVEELEDASLTLGAHVAELTRRNLERTASCALYWEKQTPEWWAERTPEQRAELEGLLAQWRVDREKLLGQLDLETRRRLEAMTLADFEQRPPG
jgi:hypothetical protein